MRRASVALALLCLAGCDPLPEASPMQATVNPEPGYSLAREEKAYLDELDRLRGEAGLEPVDRVVDTADEAIVHRTTESIRTGAIPAQDGLFDLVGHFSKKTGYPFSAVTYVPQALDGWRPEYPAALRQRPRSAAVVSITFTGSQFLVLLVYGDMDYAP